VDTINGAWQAAGIYTAGAIDAAAPAARGAAGELSPQ